MRWRKALLLVALVFAGSGCLGAGPFFLTDLTYVPETGDRLLPLDVHITDSGMIQVCMGVYDTRRIKKRRSIPSWLSASTVVEQRTRSVPTGVSECCRIALPSCRGREPRVC